MQNQKYKIINKCMLCKSNTKQVFSLGKTPLANEFTNNPNIKPDEFPLNLIQCENENCKHVQIDCIVNQELLYRDYNYVSGTSTVNVKYFENYAKEVILKYFGIDALLNGSVNQDKIVIDIGSNDGTFLQNFIKYGFNVIGIDPARNLQKIAESKGINVIPEFFNKENAKIIKSKLLNKKIKIITCNNMFAHNENLDTIIEGVLELLDDDGIFVFENSYLLDMCEKTLVDLIYHEHMHHHHLRPLKQFFKKYNMDIFNVERISNHGGSIRVYVCKSYTRIINDNVNKLLDEEKNINEKLLQFESNVLLLKNKITERLKEIKQSGHTITIYGVPAKATTLLYYFDINPNIISYVIDDAKLKQGKFLFLRDHYLYVDSNSALGGEAAQVALILAWNFADSIIKNNSNFRGTWIIPFPEYKEVQSPEDIESYIK